jgi:hypothetical protein
MMNHEDAARFCLKVLVYFTDSLIWLEIMRQGTEKCGYIRNMVWDSNCIFLEYESDTLYLSRAAQFLISSSASIIELHFI